MSIAMRHRVRDPDGTEWRVGRVWFGKRPLRSSKLGSRAGDALDAGSSGGFFDLFDGVDDAGGLLAVALVIAVVLIIVPLLLFGIELIIVGCLLAVGLVGRSLFGKPWTVVALQSGSRRPAAEWRVRGWGPSRSLIHHVCVEIEAGRPLPTGFSGAPGVEAAG